MRVPPNIAESITADFVEIQKNIKQLTKRIIIVLVDYQVISILLEILLR